MQVRVLWSLSLLQSMVHGHARQHDTARCLYHKALAHLLSVNCTYSVEKLVAESMGIPWRRRTYSVEKLVAESMEIPWKFRGKSVGIRWKNCRKTSPEKALTHFVRDCRPIGELTTQLSIFTASVRRKTRGELTEFHFIFLLCKTTKTPSKAAKLSRKI